MFRDYLSLIRLDKPIGIFLLLWPTLWALWLASNGLPRFDILMIFILGTICMRSAGCLINDFLDLKFDGHVKRTKDRALVSGKVPKKHALMILGLLLSLTALLLLFLNEFTSMLAVFAVIASAVYPLMKRFTNLAQVFLGFTFALGILFAFAAVTNSIPYNAWALYLLTVVYIIAFDTIYALIDKEDDLKIGVHSMAILLGEKATVYILVMQILFLFGMVILGKLFSLGFGYYVSLVIATLMFIYQYKLSSKIETVFQAFLNNNWVGLIIFIGIIMSLPH